MTCQPYLDENIVQEVLKRYQKYGVKLTPSKCEVFKQKISLLRRMVSENGGNNGPCNGHQYKL